LEINVPILTHFDCTKLIRSKIGVI